MRATGCGGYHFADGGSHIISKTLVKASGQDEGRWVLLGARLALGIPG